MNGSLRKKLLLILALGFLLLSGALGWFMYFIGLGFTTLSGWIGFDIYAERQSLMMYGAVISTILIGSMVLLTKSIKRSKIKALFPIDSSEALSHQDLGFLAYILEDRFRNMKKETERIEKNSLDNQEIHTKLISLFVHMDLVRHIQDKIMSLNELTPGEIKVLNEMYTKREDQRIDVVRLSQLNREDKFEKRLMKINELKAKGFFLVENFGYVRVK